MRSYLLSRLRLQRRAMAATGLAVTLAVGFVVFVLGGTATARQFVEDSAAPRDRAASVIVSASLPSSGDIVFPQEKDAATIRAVPGVAGVAVSRQAVLTVRWLDGVLPSTVQTAPDVAGLTWYTVVQGRAPAAAGEVLLDSRNAAELDVRPGSRLSVKALAGSPQPAELTVSGLYRTRGPQPGDRTLLGREADVRAWSQGADGAEGAVSQVQRIQVLAGPDTSPEQLVRAVRAAVPKLNVQTAADVVQSEVEDLTAQVDVLGRLVLGFTVIAMLVAAIVIANTFSILLAQRARELALLRCVGAGRRQLRWATQVEALLLGLVASGLGVLVGALGLVAGCAGLSATVDRLDGLRPVLTGTALLLPVFLGVVVTLLAAVLPTRQATRVAPLAALRPATTSDVRRTSKFRVFVAGLAGLLGGLLLLAGLSSGGAQGVLLGVLGGTLVVTAVIGASPVLVPAVTRLVGRVVNRFGPVARIAVGNTHRNASRSAATSTALFLGVCLIAVLTVGAGTSVRAVQDGLNRSRPLDVALVTGAERVEGGGFPGQAVSQIGNVDGVVAATGLRGVAVKARSSGGGRSGPVEIGSEGVIGGNAAAVRTVFRGSLPIADDVLLVTAGTAGPKSGQLVDLRAAGGRAAVRLRVEQVPRLPSPMVSERTLDRLGAGDRVVSIWARVADGSDLIATSDRITRVMRGLGLVGSGDEQSKPGQISVFDYSDVGGLKERAQVASATNTMILVSTGLLAVAVLISLAGIANTLSLSVLERSRESAVSRAIGMTARQLRIGLAVEAALVATVGCLLGLVVGIGLGWVGSVTVLKGLTDVGAPVIPVGRLLVVVSLALVAAVLASVLPGRRAVRVSPTQALAEG